MRFVHSQYVYLGHGFANGKDVYTADLPVCSMWSSHVTLTAVG